MGLTSSAIRLIILPAPIAAFIAYPRHGVGSSLGVATGAQAMSKPCPKRDELFDRWNAASNALRDLEALKIGAICEDSGEAERVIRDESERHSGMIPNTIGA